MTREATLTGLVHPEWVGGRRLWMDSAMTDVIDRLHFGDPTKGWEGDERLAVYYNPPRWELWRLEHDNEYRMVCQSKPGAPFNDSIIDALVARDVRRQTMSLDEQVKRHNAQLDRDRDRQADEWIGEEAAPRLAHALRHESGH